MVGAPVGAYIHCMKRLPLVTLALAASLALAGCSAGQSSSTDSAPRSASVGGAVEAAKPAPDRSVVTTGTVSLTVERPARAADRAAFIVDAAGGRVDARTEKAPADGDHGAATLTLRIPSAALDETLRRIRTLGTVVDVSLSAADVTADAQDLDARIAALRASTDRLTALLARAATTADLVAIESELTTRQSDLESLETKARSLADQVSLATVTLDLQSVATAPKPAPATFASGLATGWAALVGFLGALLVALGVALPWLALLALIAVAALGVVRRVRRRRSARPVSAP